MAGVKASFEGMKAPSFNLLDQHGDPHRLSDYKGRFVVLYFYPKDNTPGCSKQACGFRDAMEDFRSLNAVVLGVSGLNGASKMKFTQKFDLNYPLLSDEDHKVSEKYGAWVEKSLYGKAFMGINRETFIINPHGRVVKHWPRVKGNEDHGAMVAEALRQLIAGNGLCE